MMLRPTIQVAANLHEQAKQLEAWLDVEAPKPGEAITEDQRGMLYELVRAMRGQRDVLLRTDAADSSVIAFPPMPGVRPRLMDALRGPAPGGAA